MPEPLETWAIVELLGHRKIAGKVTEQQIAGAGFLRIDVPKLGESEAFTQIVNPASLYALTPVSEQVAIAMAASLDVQPIHTYEVRALAEAIERVRKRNLLPATATEDGHDEGDDGEDEYLRFA